MVPTEGSTPAFRYTSPATEAASPTWSPDGSLLAFTSKREGFDDDVWFLRTTPPGGEAFQISGVHAAPLFSDDGKWLLYGWRGPEPDSLKKDAWRTRLSPSALTRGPDPKRFDGRVYTSLPFVEDERGLVPPRETRRARDRKSTRLNSSHSQISYAVFCLKKKKKKYRSIYIHISCTDHMTLQLLNTYA